jgi:hypothetical protein
MDLSEERAQELEKQNEASEILLNRRRQARNKACVNPMKTLPERRLTLRGTEAAEMGDTHTEQQDNDNVLPFWNDGCTNALGSLTYQW